MSSELRCVFDTNVLISALLFSDSVPGTAFFRARRNGRILLSVEMARELSEVLSRAKFDRYVTSEERAMFLDTFIDEADFVEVTDRIEVCRDRKDDRVLELAAGGRADFIVTGDRDLLLLDPFQGTRIVTPADFLGLTEETGS